MAFILSIETSTSICSVALAQDGQLVAYEESLEPRSHASQLAVLIDKILKSPEANGRKLDAVAVSSGPGSYTGLRIGVSTAKGICYGQDIPLIALTTPTIMAYGANETENIPEQAWLCPMIDARRMEVYKAFFSPSLKQEGKITAEIIDTESFQEELKERPIYFFGDGSAKCQEVLTHENARFISNIDPLAKHMIVLAEEAFKKKQFEDVAYFEPFYLKNFIATAPKKNILGK